MFLRAECKGEGSAALREVAGADIAAVGANDRRADEQTGAHASAHTVADGVLLGQIAGEQHIQLPLGNTAAVIANAEDCTAVLQRYRN